MNKTLVFVLVVLAALILGMMTLTGCGCSEGWDDDQPSDDERHVHVFGEWEIEVDSTCNTDGVKKRYCSCGEKQTDVIATIGHTAVTDGVVEATCWKEGLTEGSHCSVCNEVIVEQTVVEKTAHNYGNWSEFKKPTCVVAGVEIRYCQCGAEQMRETSAKGHSTGEWVVDKEATCVSTGSRHQKCTICHNVIVTESTKATGHTEDYYSTVAVEPTCTTEGKRQWSCKHCKVIMRTEAIAATGHNYGYERVSASCTQPGGKLYTCSSCSDGYMEESEAALGHNLEISGICSRCKCDYSVDMTKRVSAPVDFAYYGSSVLYVKAEAKNTSNKTVKYFWAQIVVYNTVGDKIYTETVKVTGPISHGSSLVISRTGIDGIVMYNVDFRTTARVEIANIKIEYTDGTVECGAYGYSTTTTNRDLSKNWS